MRTGFPFFVGGLMHAGVTAAAHFGGNFKTWPSSGIVRVGRVIARRAMTVLALKPLKLRSSGRAGEPCRVPVTDSMAREATGIFILVDLLQSCKGLRMQRIHDGIVNVLVAFDTSLRADIVRCRAEDAKERV